jgi:NAD+ synthase
MDLKSKIISWIKTEVKKANAKGIIFGLSGGLDSSVLAVLSKGAVDKNILGLIIPCYSGSQEIKDARDVAGKFDIETKTVDISSIYDKVLDVLPEADRVAKGNLKARLRMVTLYYFANSMGYLVAGSGNKSELLVGYFTKYGDGGVDIMPLAGLLKTEVRELAYQLNIPENIIKKVPTAGLWEGQTDEDEMGVSYDELDKIILRIERGEKVEGGKAAGIKRMMQAAEHKLKPVPKFNPHTNY